MSMSLIWNRAARAAALLSCIVSLCCLQAGCSENPSRSATDGTPPGNELGPNFRDTGGGNKDTGGGNKDGGGGNKDTGSSGAAHYFPAGSVWTKDVSSAALDSESQQVIQGLSNAGGWGNGNVLQIDFSLEVLTADASTPLRQFNPTGDHFLPDCDIAKVPIPAGGAIEGENGYTCTGYDQDADCHLLVVHTGMKKLFEMWRADISDASGAGGTFRGGCLAIWDLTRVYPPSGRGDQCTSADAAGFPIAPLLFTADEVQAGAIEHAIRFILPNARIRDTTYVHPATHSTSSTSGGPNLPPYGARFRLKASFDMSKLPNAGAKVVARAMQKYGMLLADAGNIALTAQSDRVSTAKWSGLLGARDLDAIKVTDFEMVDGGQRINYTGDCMYNGTP